MILIITGIHFSFTGCTSFLGFFCSPSRPIISPAFSCSAFC